MRLISRISARNCPIIKNTLPGSLIHFLLEIFAEKADDKRVGDFAVSGWPLKQAEAADASAIDQSGQSCTQLGIRHFLRFQHFRLYQGDDDLDEQNKRTGENKAEHQKIRYVQTFDEFVRYEWQQGGGCAHDRNDYEEANDGCQLLRVGFRRSSNNRLHAVEEELVDRRKQEQDGHRTGDERDFPEHPEIK